MTQIRAVPTLIDVAGLPEYPISASVRLDSHEFIAWEFRRFLQSEFRWTADHQVKSIWFDLIQQAHEQTPVGTLPVDHARLARMVQPPVDPVLFSGLAALDIGVLYGWRKCVCDNGDVRLMHDTVTRVVINALSRKELNAARTDGASTQKRLVRLAETLAGIAPAIAMEPAQVRWVDAHIRDAMEADGNKKRTQEQLHGAIQACLEKVCAGFFRKPPK
ncbi:hypothetical protein [Puniceibacterium sp. IMCC21224]|uniref:hypothetical protein n=1 Tax=Puniceibacterium sp. IMCC21224 TaxID=1618204 RepID=UPI0012E0B48E|nr:hypothetical protein [Puniceibacterium sp. IMCC21224]